MAEQTDSQTRADEAGASLGAVIRTARQARGLEAADLAHCLRLEPRIIQALEDEAFDKLPPPAFVHGYLRAIGKELGIDSGPLVAQYDTGSDSAPPPLSDFESRAPAQITSDSTVIQYTTGALVLVMIAMVVLWWQGQEEDPPVVAGDALNSAPQPAQASTPPLDYAFDQVTHSDAPYFRASPPPRSIDSIPDEPAAQPDVDEASGLGTPSIAPADDAALAQPSEPPRADSGDISITVSDEAWVDIKDATERRLYFDLVKPGRPVVLSGSPPYQFVVGNSPAVELRFRGELIELGRYDNDGVARFELGE